MEQTVESELNIQLGHFVGEKIITYDLPTLSTDMLRTRNVIKVSDELTKIWKEKDAKWYEARTNNVNNGGNHEDSDKIFYENLEWYKINIENVYLKPELVIPIHNLYCIGNKELLLKGINDALWDSDLSHYTASDVVEGNYGGFKIILKKDEYKLGG